MGTLKPVTLLATSLNLIDDLRCPSVSLRCRAGLCLPCVRSLQKIRAPSHSRSLVGEMPFLIKERLVAFAIWIELGTAYVHYMAGGGFTLTAPNVLLSLCPEQ